jgi:hypothetical protein
MTRNSPSFDKRPKGLQDIITHKGFLARYVLLPLSVLTLLWTFFRSSSPSSGQAPSRISGGIRPDGVLYDKQVPTYPPPRPASWKSAAEEVKQEFMHAWSAYDRIASPHDELRPLSHGHINKCARTIQ